MNPSSIFRRCTELLLVCIALLSLGSGAAADEALFPQRPLPADRADVGVVFIGGLGDEVSGIVAGLRHVTPSLLMEGETREGRAYYCWHADHPGATLEDAPRSIARDVEAFRRVHPGADVVLVGHSLGGSVALRTAQHLSPSQGRVYLLTLDAVDCTLQPARPESVAWWGNSYVVHSASRRDVIAKWGGRWGACDGADVNICFDGREEDESGSPYIHDHAAALLMSRKGKLSSRGGKKASLLDGLRHARRQGRFLP